MPESACAGRVILCVQVHTQKHLAVNSVLVLSLKMNTGTNENGCEHSIYWLDTVCVAAVEVLVPAVVLCCQLTELAAVTIRL